MSAELALKLIETNEVETKALSIVDESKNIQVIDSETYIKAGKMWQDLGAMLKEIDAAFDENISMWHKGHKAAVAKKKSYYDPVDSARRSVKTLMERYDDEQERIRQAEQRRLAEEARKAEEERRLEEAIFAEEAGNQEEAEAIIQEPVYVAPVVVPKATPKMTGGPIYREVWSAEVTDIRALCKAVAEGKASPECVMGNMPVLNKMATALKTTMSIPGVKAYSRRV